MADEPKPKLERGVVTLSIYCGYKEKGREVKERYKAMALAARRSFSDLVKNLLDGHKP